MRQKPMLYRDLLFIPRFDRKVMANGVERFHQESAASQSWLRFCMHIVYNLVTEVLRGKIDVESRIGAGTTLRLRLPSQIPVLAG